MALAQGVSPSQNGGGTKREGEGERSWLQETVSTDWSNWLTSAVETKETLPT